MKPSHLKINHAHANNKDEVLVSGIIEPLEQSITSDHDIDDIVEQSISPNDTSEPHSPDESYQSLYTNSNDDTKSSTNTPHKSHSSSVLSDILSSSAKTIRMFQSNDDTLISSSHRSSKIYDYKEFLKKEKTVGNQLNELLAPATPTITQFQSNEDHSHVKFAIKQQSNTNKLAELLAPATPTINSFQSNEDHFNFDAAALNDDLFLLDDDEESDYEQDVDLLEIELSTINNENDTDIHCTSVKKCVAIKRMVTVLKCYQKIDKTLIETLKTIETEQNMSILNDYHHILLHHLEASDSVYKEFESIYKEMDCVCDMKECSKYRRQRERHTENKSDNNDELNEEEESSDEYIIYYAELMDSIHCYLLHSYDTGMRVKKKPESKIPPPPKHSKKKSVLTMDDVKKMETHTNKSNNKYYTNVNAFGGVFNKAKKKKKSASRVSFDFGYKYYYWPYYKDNEYFDCGPNTGYKKGDWYILKKYDTLKDEILNNHIHRLSVKEFEKSRQKALRYLAGNIAKALRSDSGELSEYCQIKPGSAISCDNLLAVVLYTDYTNLCYHFSSTFRKISEIEQISEIKNRNSEYANWSKWLIETVELFGTNICNSKIEIFYHGVSTMTFPSFLAYFCGPTSTTTQLEVAKNFCGSKGLILELVKENEFSLLKYFNCQWIGAFTAEDEKLFIGGYRPLKFYSILNLQTLGNYYHFIVSLTLFDYVLSGKRLSDKDKESKIYSAMNAKIINKLLKHYDPTTDYTNKFPLFVNDLFRTFVENKKQILIHLDAIHDDYPFIAQYLFTKKCSNLIQFDRLAKCFRYCVKVTVYSGSVRDNDMSKAYLDELRVILNQINELSSNAKAKISLTRIKLTDVKYNNEYLDDVFTRKYRLMFPFCKLRVDTQTRLQIYDQTRAKKAKDSRDRPRRNVRTLKDRRKNRGRLKKVGFAANEAFEDFERIVIRSDLIINRSKSLLQQIEEASRAHTTIGRPNMPLPGSLREETSQSGSITSAPSSARASYIYDEESILDISRANLSTSRLFNGRQSESHRITDYARDPTHLMKQIARDLPMGDVLRQRLFTMHEEDALEIEAAELTTSDNLLGMQQFAFANTELTDCSILRINGFAARKLWMASCSESNKFMIHYDDLYPNIIAKFQQLTGCEHRAPSKAQLAPFLGAFKEMKEDDPDAELSMQSKCFDGFYEWFKSLCRIICDFKHIYDNEAHDILSGLFYDKGKAEEVLSFEEYKIGTFVLRIAIKEKNELMVSYKDEDQQIKHNALRRCDEDTIYQIANSTKQLPIFTLIRSANCLRFLCIEGNLVKNKNVYF